MKSSNKIVLVIPPLAGAHKDHLPSMGVGYLAAILERNNYEVKIIDSFAEDLDNDQTVNAVLKEAPFLAGISANTHNRFSAIGVIEGIKEKSNGEIFTVAGGPHFSPTAEQAVANIPSLDIVVRGEGEETLLQLVNQIRKDLGVNPENLKRINGLTFRDGGKIFSTSDREFIKNLDELPTPAWHLFNLNKYNARLEGLTKYRAIGVASSRGCPHNCNFCVNSVFWKRVFRMHSPKRFVDDLEILFKQYGFRAFDFWDDTMTIYRSHIEEICREILRRKLLIKWYARARVDTIDFDLLSLMKKAGCEAISFGVESGSERILKVIDKKINLNQVRNIAKICRDLNLVTKFFFVYSLPQENEDDLNSTFDLIDELELYSPKLHCYGGLARIYPGTQLEFLAKKEGKIPNDFNWYKKIYFETNEEVGADPIIPLYENGNVPLKRIVEMIKQRRQQRIKKKGLFNLIKKGLNFLFKIRSINDLKLIIKKIKDIVS
jgi:radical SAM superfamily enzyme YgiQ (UPF0313 family)